LICLHIAQQSLWSVRLLSFTLINGFNFSHTTLEYGFAHQRVHILMVGMPVVLAGHQQNLRSVFADYPHDLAHIFIASLYSAVGHSKIDAPGSTEYRSRPYRFLLPQYGIPSGAQLSTGAVCDYYLYSPPCQPGNCTAT